MTRALTEQLDWQVAVNGILIEAGYHSDEFGLLSRADMIRMEACYRAGWTPEHFAHDILARAAAVCV